MMQTTPMRAGLYLFFASLFRYPDEEEWRFVNDAVGVAREHLAELRRSTEAFDPFAAELLLRSREEIEPLYVRTFLNALPSIVAPPYESLYGPDHRRLAVLAEVSDFYERCGVHLADDFRDMPDHIATELEFMHYLCVEEAGTPEYRRTIAGAEREFLRDHLAPFAQALAAALPEGLYHHAAESLREFVEGDLAGMEWEVADAGGIA